MESISIRLKKLRIRAGLSQVTLAGLVQIPVTTYRDWENGKAITGEPYEKLAAQLGVSVNYLVTGQRVEACVILDSLDKLIEDVKIIRKNVLSLK